MNHVILYTDMTCQMEAVAELRGREGLAPPPGPKSFNFMQFWRKFAKIICWCPPGELVPHLGEILDPLTGLRSQCRKIHVVPELPTHALTHIHTHAQTDRQTHVTYLSVGPDLSGCTCCLSPATTWCTG